MSFLGCRPPHNAPPQQAKETTYHFLGAPKAGGLGRQVTPLGVSLGWLYPWHVVPFGLWQCHYHGALPPHEALASAEVALIAHQACLPCGWCCGLNIMITIGVQAVLVYPALGVWPWGGGALHQLGWPLGALLARPHPR